MALWTLSGFWMKGKMCELCTMPSTRNIATYQTECAVSQRKGTSEDRQTPEQRDHLGLSLQSPLGCNWPVAMEVYSE